MKQAIVTKYHEPTDNRGSRIIATASAGRVIVEYDDALSVEANHRAAATALASKFDWLDAATQLYGGGLPDGGYCFLLIDR